MRSFTVNMTDTIFGFMEKNEDVIAAFAFISGTILWIISSVGYIKAIIGLIKEIM